MTRALVVGSGGREHCLGWALARAPSIESVASAPGNPGLREIGPCHAVQPEKPLALVDLAERLSVDLVVIGPEVPLVAGAADALLRAGVPVFGPTAAAAEIEGSKAFAKEVMAAAGVPTAGYSTHTDAPEALEALERYEPPYVIKADGLAAGKGVVICETRAEAEAAVEDALVRRTFGAAGERVVIEEFLEGPEASVLGVCDGTDVVLLPAARDYKRALDGDEGPNTGGMGAYSPLPDLDETQVAALRRSVFEPVLAEMRRRDRTYVGVLYAGLALTPEGPKVVEFNCRFGDPETQVVVPQVTSDVADLLCAAVDPSRGVRNAALDVSGDAFVTVVLASGGYPGRYDIGEEIHGVDVVGRDHPDAVVFHAGTRGEDGRLLTAGGRVLNVVGRGSDVAAAREVAYAAADEISWERLHRRGDIALDASTG